MTLDEAFNILELDASANDDLLKEQYRWFVKTYHPDMKPYGNAREFILATEAYNVVRKHRK